MKSIRQLWVLALALSVLPLAVNIFGRNVFLNLLAGDRAVVIAASQGFLHLAYTSEEVRTDHPDDFALDTVLLEEIGFQVIMDFGPIYLFVEHRVDPISFFRFNSTLGNELYNYASIEFPLLLLPILWLTAALTLKKKPDYS